MRRIVTTFVALLAAVAVAGAQTFTDINSAQYYGEINNAKTYGAIDANFGLIESGSVDGSFDALSAANDVAFTLNAAGEEFYILCTNGGETADYVMRILDQTDNPGSKTLLILDYVADGDADAEYIACRDNASGDIKFKVDVDGLVTLGTDLDVTEGGTGVGTLTDHGVLVGSGTADITALSVGTDNQVMRGSTGADPAFGALVDADIPDDITINDSDGTLIQSNVTLTAGGTLTADNIEEAGTAGVSLEGLTLNDGSFTDADGSLTVSNITLTGGGVADLGDNIATNVGAVYADSLAPDDTALAIDTGTGEATIDGKYAVVGPDASTAFMLDGGSNALNSAGVVTQSFTAAFGALPFVTASYGEDPATNQNVWVGPVATDTVVINGAASKSVYWTAVGARP